MATLTRADIAAKLKGIERYNPENIDLLVDYLDSQCKNNHYDLEANLAILKLYQFNPMMFQAQVVEKVLLKALTNLPHPDFILCKCLIDPTRLDSGKIQAINEMHHLLELCQFRKFWHFIFAHCANVMQEDLAATREVVLPVESFEESIRKCITYQHIKASLLQDLLGFRKDEEMDAWIEKYNWKLGDDGYVTVANQEDKIKTINITEKIELEQVANILATYR